MISLRFLRRAFLVVLLAGLIPGAAVAFPPLPHHTVYGLVRDEFGNPLTASGTELILDTLSGTSLSTSVVAGLEAGVNYRINVPVDAGLTDDLYRPTALRPTAPFRIRVKIAGRTYVPLEMKANMAQLGQPAQSSRVDLTLGEDTDGDGLPDAWERSVIAAGKLGVSLSGLNPNDRLNGNPLSVLQAYIAGTYAWDPKDGFRVDIVQFEGLNPVLEFLALRGRSYSVIGSDDLATWVPVPVQVQGASASGTVNFYQSSQLKQVRVTVPADSGKAPPKFFKLLVK
ncbi:MAG: hypothetical protein RLZZ356_624 [Verrucomicrobiota bacterium]|jgi:hypothetical protein